MLAAPNRFLSRSSDKCQPMFLALKKKAEKIWDKQCDKALAKIKQYLSSPPILLIPNLGEELILYLAVFEHAVSAALMRGHGKHQLPIYFVSKMLLDAHTRYLPFEKLALALVNAARKLKHYFRAHTVMVLTEHPLRTVL